MAKLLLLDDDAEALAWMAPALELKGHEVRAFTRSTAALDEMQEWTPDLIVADIVMTEMNGLEFARLTRRLRGVPLMFVSVASLRAEAVIAGAVGYVQKPATAAEVRAEVERVLGSRGERSTVLVVDDDPAARWLFRSFLGSHFDVLEAEQGAEALELLSSHRVDLAIVDVHMPVMGGAELIRRMRSTPSLERIPVIVQTGDRGALGAPVWRDLHVALVIEKDDFVEWLAGRIDAHLREHRPPSAEPQKQPREATPVTTATAGTDSTTGWSAITRLGKPLTEELPPERRIEELKETIRKLVTEREELLRCAAFLADATRLLFSLDFEQALDGVAHLAVPFLADGCAIDVFDGEPRRFVAVSPRSASALSLEIHPTVLRGHSLVYELGSVSHLGVPVRMKGHLMGAITLSSSYDRAYTRAHLELTEELARRMALSIDNARLYRRTQEAVRERDDFLSIAAHEIRGPINSIHLAVQSIRQAKVPTDALPRLFELVERQDRRLSQFVDELLDLGRIRAGALQLETQKVDLGEVVAEVAVRLGPELTLSGSSLTVTAQRRIVGQWDKSRLDQVVQNLLSNAIKFGLGKPIELSVTSLEGRARLTVRDHGIGIDAAARDRIFQPFERNVSVRNYGGLGLGLHIVKTTVEALGGAVRVESEPGAGSTFVVELPLRLHEATDAHPRH